MVLVILVRLCLILASSAAAPLNPIVDKEATEENLVTDYIARVDIVKGGDMDGDGLHSHTNQNTARDARLVFYGGDVVLSGSVDITGDHARIASIISNHVSASGSSQDHQPVSEAAVDGVWSDWGECSATRGLGSQTRTCDIPSPANGGTICVGDTDLQNGRLEAGSEMISQNSLFKLIMRLDGNLVISSQVYGVVWHTDTAEAGSYFTFQEDGDLVCYNKQNVVWSSGTRGLGAHWLVIKDDGFLALYGSDGKTISQNHRRQHFTSF